MQDTQDLGQIVFTAGIDQAIKNGTLSYGLILRCVLKHNQGDWGDLCDEDKEANDFVYLNKNGGRLLSCYKLQTLDKQEVKIWIITSGFGNAHQGPEYCNTVIMFPSEY